MYKLDIKTIKSNFILDIAIKNSIGSAITLRKQFFSKESSAEMREEFRRFLGDETIKIASKYKNQQTEQQCIIDMKKLMDSVNKQFKNKGLFQNKYGFTLGQSQKVLTVYLKYLWCLDRIPLPPRAPLDGIMLRISEAPYNMRTWGDILDINEYEEKYCYLVKKAKLNNIPVPVYELLGFHEENRLKNHDKN